MKKDQIMTIDCVVDKKQIKGRQYFLVNWEGLSQQYSSWVPQIFIPNDKMEEFKGAYPLQKQQLNLPTKGNKINENLVNGNKTARVYDKQFEIEDIVATRIAEDGSTEYRIKWKNYPPNQNTWQPEEHIPEQTRRDYHNWKEQKKQAKQKREHKVQEKEKRRPILSKSEQNYQKKQLKKKNVQIQEPIDLDSGDSPFQQTKGYNQNYKNLKTKRIKKEAFQTKTSDRRNKNIMLTSIEDLKKIPLYDENSNEFNPYKNKQVQLQIFNNKSTEKPKQGKVTQAKLQNNPKDSLKALLKTLIKSQPK